MRAMNSLLLLAASLFTLPAMAGKESGGGIIIAAEFATAGRQAIQILSEGDRSLDFAAVLEAIKETKIIPVDNICYVDPVLNREFCEDAHYDAKNNVILFSHAKWDSFTCAEKFVLSTHELLRAAGLESEDYGYSGRFITGRIAKCKEESRSRGRTTDEFKCADLSILLQNKMDGLCGNLVEQYRERQRRKQF